MLNGERPGRKPCEPPTASRLVGVRSRNAPITWTPDESGIYFIGGLPKQGRDVTELR